MALEMALRLLVAAGVVVGVGFLGAGVILHREGGIVAGLTTAATIWVMR